MKILHTADWHLGDRLGRVSRDDDLRAAVERVARICAERAVDVLLIAGDLFSELARPDSLRDSIEHLQATFREFLVGGGTILALTGNHDNENFCQTLRLVMTLAAPLAEGPGELLLTGRLHLATQPMILRLPDRGGGQVQFVMLPYPTPPRYLREDETQRWASLEEKNLHLRDACLRKLRELLGGLGYDSKLPTVLAAHVQVHSAKLASLFRMSEAESIVFSTEDFPDSLAYVALGHVHRAQCLGGKSHVRYSGSIERLDLGESEDQKGVVLFDIGPEGLRGEPEVIPLEATPIYAVEFHDPKLDLPRLVERYPEAERDLVRLQFTYRAGTDNLEEILRSLEQIFPRYYERNWTEASALGGSLTVDEPGRGKSFGDTVRDYLNQELTNHEEDRVAVLALAEMLIAKVQP